MLRSWKKKKIRKIPITEVTHRKTYDSWWKDISLAVFCFSISLRISRHVILCIWLITVCWLIKYTKKNLFWIWMLLLPVRIFISSPLISLVLCARLSGFFVYANEPSNGLYWCEYPIKRIQMAKWLISHPMIEAIKRTGEREREREKPMTRKERKTNKETHKHNSEHA